MRRSPFERLRLGRPGVRGQIARGARRRKVSSVNDSNVPVALRAYLQIVGPAAVVVVRGAPVHAQFVYSRQVGDSVAPTLHRDDEVAFRPEVRAIVGVLNTPVVVGYSE